MNEKLEKGEYLVNPGDIYLERKEKMERISFCQLVRLLIICTFISLYSFCGKMSEKVEKPTKD